MTEQERVRCPECHSVMHITVIQSDRNHVQLTYECRVCAADMCVISPPPRDRTDIVDLLAQIPT
jgi:hypothetical protein